MWGLKPAFSAGFLRCGAIHLTEAAQRLADWIEEEQVDAELDEVKFAMVCEALIEAVGNHKIYLETR